MTIMINEIFHSIQGEGLRSGIPTTFIRTTGCNLRCGWCDTTHAYDEGKDMTIEDIVAEAGKYRETRGSREICLTGGEPLLQEEVPDLVHALLAEEYDVTIETNGSLSIASLLQSIHMRTLKGSNVGVNSGGSSGGGGSFSDRGGGSNEGGEDDSCEVCGGSSSKGGGSVNSEVGGGSSESGGDITPSDAVEHSGSQKKDIDASTLFLQFRERLHISLDVKCPSSGESEKLDVRNFNLLSDMDQLKFVINDRRDLEYALEVMWMNPVFCPTIIQPVMGDEIERSHIQMLIGAFLESVPRDRDVRFMVQTHKVIWGNKSGV